MEKMTVIEKAKAAKNKRIGRAIIVNGRLFQYRLYTTEPRHPDDIWGFIPEMLNVLSPDDPFKQLNDGYQHGGGWRPFEGFRFNVTQDENKWQLLYSGDTPQNVVAVTDFKHHRIAIFEHAWVACIRPDNTYQIARMD